MSMTSQTEPSVDLGVADLTRMYRGMYVSRQLDERQRALKRQQKTFFQLSCAGHEAVLVAAGLVVRPGVDWLYPYYRDQALCLMLGMRVEDVLLEAVGAGEAPFSGGRQMPNHWGDLRLNLVSRSSTTGMQFLHAVGCAEATRYASKHPPATEGGPLVSDGSEITWALSGEGATSEGEFWEALSAASVGKLPVLFLVEDNGYAISVPVDVQTPGGDISKLVSGFPNLLVRTCDGTDPRSSYRALMDAAAHCRSGAGPALVRAQVVLLEEEERALFPREGEEIDLVPRKDK